MASHRKQIVLLVTTVAFTALGVSLFSYPTISTIVSAEFHLSYAESGLITSAFSIAFAVMQIPAGLLADRFGGGRVLLGSLVVAAFSPLIFVAGSSFQAALTSRALAGAACAAILPSSIRLISSWFPKEELNRAMSVLGSGIGIAQVLSFAVLPVLVIDGDWRPPLSFVIAFASVVAAMAVLPAVWRAAKASGESRLKVDVRGLLTRNLVALTLPNLAALAVLVGVLAWGPAFLSQRFGLSNVDAGRIIILIGIMTILASFAGGYMARMFGARKTIAISMGLAVVFPILLASASSELSAILWMCGVGVACQLYFASVFALVPYAARQGPEAAGIEFGVFNSLSNLGSLSSPILLGYILDSTGSFTLGFIILGLFAVTGVVGAALLDTRRGKAGATLGGSGGGLLT